MKILSEVHKVESFIFTNTENAIPIEGFKIFYIREGILSSINIIFLALKFKIKILDIQYIYGLYGGSNRRLLGYFISAYTIISLLVLCQLFKIRSVLTMHSIIQDLTNESVLNEMKNYSYLNKSIHIFNKLIVLLSSSTVVLSDLQYSLLKDFPVVYKLHLIHHGIDSLNLKQESHPDFTFSYIGMIRPNKGVLVLLDAFKKISEKYNKVKLFILGGVGDSLFYEYEHYFQTVKMKIKELQSDYNVEFHEGWIEEKEILKVLKFTDTIVFPYIDNANEISGAAFTYASSGIPFVCSDIPRFNSSFSNNETAVFFKCCSSNELFMAMEEIMNNRKLRDRISSNLKAMSEKYNWEENAKEYYKIYRSLLKLTEMS